MSKILRQRERGVVLSLFSRFAAQTNNMWSVRADSVTDEDVALLSASQPFKTNGNYQLQQLVIVTPHIISGSHINVDLSLTLTSDLPCTDVALGATLHVFG